MYDGILVLMCVCLCVYCRYECVQMCTNVGVYFYMCVYIQMCESRLSVGHSLYTTVCVDVCYRMCARWFVFVFVCLSVCLTELLVVLCSFLDTSRFFLGRSCAVLGFEVSKYVVGMDGMF